jgi:hypothetical protein
MNANEYKNSEAFCGATHAKYSIIDGMLKGKQREK